MTRQEALEHFQKEAEPILEEGKEAFLGGLPENIEELSRVLCQAIQRLREECVRLEKEKIMFIHFSLLRTGFGKEEYQVLAQAMDARWYLDTEPAEIEFSIGFLFCMWGGVRQKLTEESKKYMGKVNRYDIGRLTGDAMIDCNFTLAQTLRFMFRDIEENPDFMKLGKLDTWGIYWGEYKDNAELIAHVDREKKNQLDWDRALRQTRNEEGSMVFGFWYGAELRDSDCSGKKLHFIQFEDCTLEHICFDNAVLTGARFRHCRIKDCSFRNAVIRQADFSECTWEGNHFEGADMERTVFLEQELPFVHLEPEQLQTILIDRGQ